MTTGGQPHVAMEASAWVRRWSHLLPAGGRVLDVACGEGRHLRWLAALGHEVTGVDRSAPALATLPPAFETIVADLENGPWPLAGRAFDAVVVTNYLWRPLWPSILGSLAPGAVLLYETFAAGQQTVGKPSRPDFLLQAGELLQACAGLRVVAYEDGFEGGWEHGAGRAIGPGAEGAPSQRQPRFVQRIVAVRPAGAGPSRYPLAAPAADT
jgi:SAM-dependent methyltransferase